jgi:hypothetical protein
VAPPPPPPQPETAIKANEEAIIARNELELLPLGMPMQEAREGMRCDEIMDTTSFQTSGTLPRFRGRTLNASRRMKYLDRASRGQIRLLDALDQAASWRPAVHRRLLAH